MHTEDRGRDTLCFVEEVCASLSANLLETLEVVQVAELPVFF